MTHDDLQIVLDVLLESSRLSKADAQALTIEIARRVLTPREPPKCACWTAYEWEHEEVLVGHLYTCDEYVRAKAAL